MDVTHQIGTRGLDGAIAVVTGGGRGIGAAISEALSREGAHVVLVGETLETLEKRQAGLANESTVIATDLAVDGAAESLVDSVVDRFGGVDVLVNNAGRASGGPSDQVATDELDAVWALNVRTPLLLSGRLAASMAGRGGGSIVTISSALAERGMPQNMTYAASKGAMEAATRALASEWGQHGVRVNAIRPAVTRTDMAAAIVEDATLLENYLTSVPAGRVGEAEEVAELALFLASPAASYITGQIISVDGGWGSTARSIFGA